MEQSRVFRLLRIVTLLQSRRGYNARTLAEELEVSERTIYRDLNALELAAVPYHFDPQTQGYFIKTDFFLPPVQLTLGEALALSALASQLARQRQIPFLEDAWRAMAKIESQLPSPIQEELAATDGNLLVQTARAALQEGADGHFRLIRQALAEKRKVHCVYEGGIRCDHGEPFLFRPYALFFSQRAWYVVGYSELAEEERSLKLNRIKQLTLTDRPYMIPADWSLQRHLGKAWRMIRGEKRYHVRVQFDEEFGRTMADTLWHPTQQVIWREGECIFECDVDGLSEIVWWVLGYGPHAQVLEPSELRDEVLKLAEQVCRLYQIPAVIAEPSLGSPTR